MGGGDAGEAAGAGRYAGRYSEGETQSTEYTVGSLTGIETTLMGIECATPNPGTRAESEYHFFRH